MNRVLHLLQRWTIAVVLLSAQPSLANKFETIGSGVSGSRGLKIEWLQGFLFVVCGILALGAVLAVAVPHRNTLFLNAVNWKTSAVLMALLAAAVGALAWSL